MVDWSDEKLAALADKDLKTLLANAERKSATDLVAKCTAEIEKRAWALIEKVEPSPNLLSTSM